MLQRITINVERDINNKLNKLNMLINQNFDKANRQRKKTHYQKIINEAKNINFSVIVFLGEIHNDNSLSDKQKQKARNQVYKSLLP